MLGRRWAGRKKCYLGRNFPVLSAFYRPCFYSGSPFLSAGQTHVHGQPSTERAFIGPLYFPALSTYKGGSCVSRDQGQQPVTYLQCFSSFQDDFTVRSRKCVLFFPFMEKIEMSLLLENFEKEVLCYLIIHPRRQAGDYSQYSLGQNSLLNNQKRNEWLLQILQPTCCGREHDRCPRNQEPRRGHVSEAQKAASDLSKSTSPHLTQPPLACSYTAPSASCGLRGRKTILSPFCR